MQVTSGASNFIRVEAKLGFAMLSRRQAPRQPKHHFRRVEMNNRQKRTSKAAAVTAITFMLAAILTTGTLHAREWQAGLGAQSGDLGSQALAFLPNELWIHTNDSIRWTIASTEIHTVTFFTPGEIRPPFFGVFGVPNGCPGTPNNTPDGSSFDGSTCVNSGIMGTFDTIVGPRSYSVKFPAAGNFKFVCLVHFDMTGAVHVLNPAEALPYDQDFYNREAQTDGTALVADASRLTSRGLAEDNDGGPAVKVTAGVGAIVTTSGGGSQTTALMRFLRDVIVVRVGDTVEWTNLDPSTPHTVTFGTEPADPRPPSGNVASTSDAARQAVISSPADSVNSGLLTLAFQDRPMLPQSPLGVTHFRVTFKSPGVFNYICALHDNLGMKGMVIVHQ
jgi:plastocyanin